MVQKNLFCFKKFKIWNWRNWIVGRDFNGRNVWKRKTKITEKSCLCVGLANASYLENDMKIKGQAQGVVICPDPIWLILIRKCRFLKWCNTFMGILPYWLWDRRICLSKNWKCDYLKNEIKVSQEITAGQIKKMECI
jgi:hypothetical protein